MLASLDERAYQRAVLKDAESIARGLLIPMALPWMHEVEPVARNIPCDIDDLTEVVTADDGYHTPFENGSFGFGRFDGGQIRQGNPTLRLANSMDAQCSASRRSNDPGVLELCSVTLPPAPTTDDGFTHHNESDNSNNDNSSSSSNNNNNKNEASLHCQANNGQEDLPEGEASLRVFEEVQANRVQRTSQSSTCARRKHISVRVNSSSSRSKIFPPAFDPSYTHPYLEAKLPAEVQTGEKKRIAQARKIAKKLGSFNISGKIEAPSSSNGSSRVNVGRCQLMWSQKLFSDQLQRGSYFSRLTGSKMESGQHKRPTEIRVRLKVNGKLFVPRSKNVVIEDTANINPTTGSADTVGYGIDNSFSTSVGGTSAARQCILDSERLMDTASRSADTSDISINDGKGSKIGHYPTFDCVQSLDGQICTVCTAPGKISLKSVFKQLNDEAKNGGTVCTVCWKTSAEDGSAVRECLRCGLLVHPSCCLNPGILERNTETGISSDRWKCTVCDSQAQNAAGGNSVSSNKSRRKSRPPAWLKEAHVVESSLGSREEEQDSSIDSGPELPKCALCPYTGGAMSKYQAMGEGTWVHEVCRLWATDQLVEKHELGSDKGQGTAICALCGGVETITRKKQNADQKYSRLIKCAGSKCCVYFHPMCGLLSKKRDNRPTKLSPPSDGEPFSCEKAKSIDQDLCTQFTLTNLQCEYSAEDRGMDRRKRLSRSIRIGFCGLHNPQRERTFYGMYPGGLHTQNGILSIPSLK